MSDFPDIPELPEPPIRNEAPADFSRKASEFLGALPGFQAALNAAGQWIAQALTDIGTALSQALSARDEAEEARDEAVSAASAATAVVDAQLWVSGQPYAQGEAAISPLDMQTYRRKSAGGGTTDPSLDSTNWAQITGIGALPAMGGKAGRALVVNPSETGAEWSNFRIGTNAQGTKHISTSEPSGTSPGDVWYQVES